MLERRGTFRRRGAMSKGSGSRVKPPTFAYHRPASVAEAVATLADWADGRSAISRAGAGAGAAGGAKVLAGGQSLVPLLNMRLAAPAALVDINRLTDELAFVEATP